MADSRRSTKRCYNSSALKRSRRARQLVLDNWSHSSERRAPSGHGVRASGSTLQSRGIREFSETGLMPQGG